MSTAYGHPSSPCPFLGIIDCVLVFYNKGPAADGIVELNVPLDTL